MINFDGFQVICHAQDPKKRGVTLQYWKEGQVAASPVYVRIARTMGAKK